MATPAVSKLRAAVRNPRLVCRELNKLSHRVVPWWDYRRKGDDFMAEDWDNLLILDACRYDLFAAENTMDGRLEKRHSKASSTVGFLRTNIDGVDLTDTVYVTANGQLHNYEESIDATFHDILPLYAEEWDDDLGTVPSDAVTERALEAEQEYPNKRLLVHYVQPHFPFIGSDVLDDVARIGDEGTERAFWRRVFDGDVSASRDELWDAYRATLETALDDVERCVDGLGGKTVVTADHGNMFGERGYPIPIREWGHPDNTYYRPLVEVPWLVSEGSQRKRTVAEPPRDHALEPDPAVVEERLEDLGYKQ